MALTLKEQLDILTGLENPPSGYPILELVKQISIIEAKNILGTYKLFSQTGNELAYAYLQKILHVCNRINLGDQSAFDSLTRIVIAIYAETGTIAQVQAATDAGWETFLSNNIYRAFELFSEVRQDEKTSYDSI